MAIKGSLADNTNISDARMRELERITIQAVDTIETDDGRPPIMSEVLNYIAENNNDLTPIELLVVGSTVGRAYYRADLGVD